jgi:transporter family-2 protein
LLLAATAAAGALQPLQAALNARLSSLLGGGAQGVPPNALTASLVAAVPSPLQAITISFCISAVITSALSAIFVKHDAWAALPAHLLELPKLAAMLGAPAQAFVLLGGAIIPKNLGTASYYTLLIAGEMLTSLGADSLGILGLERRALTLARASGVALIIGAAATLSLDTHQKPPSAPNSNKLESNA